MRVSCGFAERDGNETAAADTVSSNPTQTVKALMRLRNKPFWLIAFALLSVACCSGQAAKCDGQLVIRSNYTVCLPPTWDYVREDRKADRLSACNVDVRHCTGDGGGFPVRGAVFLIVAPVQSSRVDGLTAERIARSSDPSGSSQIEAVDLGPGKQCFLGRTRMMEKVWNDVYGLQIGTKSFRVWSQYLDTTSDRLKAYRDDVKAILSSVEVKVSQ